MYPPSHLCALAICALLQCFRLSAAFVAPLQTLRGRGRSIALFESRGIGQGFNLTDPSAETPSTLVSTIHSRPSRETQIEQLQGFWWILDNKDHYQRNWQLVEIRSSYAIFDAPRSSPRNTPARMFCLGGTKDIVTLRGCKLLMAAPVPAWSSPVTSFDDTRVCWRRCNDPLLYWNAERIIPGYEKDIPFEEMPLWSASPLDVAIDRLDEEFGPITWNLDRSDYHSQSCSLYFTMKGGKKFRVGLICSEDGQDASDTQWLQTTMDFELAVHGRVWKVNMFEALSEDGSCGDFC